MRVLLDECLPGRLRSCFSAHECRTVPEMGLAGKKNGELLRRAELEFDVFLTIDAGIPSQQNLAQNRISVILLRARSNRFRDLEPLLPRILDALKKSAFAGALREMLSSRDGSEPDPEPQASSPDEVLGAAYLRDTNSSKALASLANYEARLERSFFRALRELTKRSQLCP